MAGIFQADIYCDDCIEDIKCQIADSLWEKRSESFTPDGIRVDEWYDFEEFDAYLRGMDEREYDSDAYPKHCDDDETSDSPQHCGSHEHCLNPTVLADGTKIGHFFGNSLTTYGDEYVAETVLEDLESGRNDSVAIEVWKPYYDYISYPGFDD